MPRVAHEHAELLRIGVRVLGDEALERIVMGEHLLAPALGAMESGDVRVRDGFPRAEPRAYRLRVDAAHEFPDVLQLTPPRLEARDAPCRRDGVAQVLGQRDRLELRVVEPGELRAECLQGMHVFFLPGLAGAVVGNHDSLSCRSCYDNALSRTLNRLQQPVRAPDFRTMPDTRFTYAHDKLKEIVRDVLAYAQERGASAAEAEASEGFGQTVTVRHGEVETIEYNRDKGVGVTVYIGKQRGHASTSDFTSKAMRDTVDAALSIARFTASDDCAGLADPDLIARDVPDLDLRHPWDLPVERAIDLAKACEGAGFAVDPRVSNSEGATVSTQENHFAYGNTLGFLGGYPSSRHGVWCSLIAGRNDAMQRDDWYETARDPADLPPAETVGRRAGERAIRRLGARKIATTQVPVLFEAPVAASLLAHFAAAVSGGNLYRRASFLLDSLGQQVFAPQVKLSDLPHIPKGLASSPFDDEGVATQARDIVSDGVVRGYFLGSYSARKLGLRSTGNAGGSHNLILHDTGEDFAALLRKMGRGMLVTELMGQGVNNVTGDYSRGAAGYWVENGAIVYPVQEITIAGNLKDMFRGIVAAGNDIVRRGARQCGSILVERMTIAGD